jgi:hypothetical protein
MTANVNLCRCDPAGLVTLLVSLAIKLNGVDPLRTMLMIFTSTGPTQPREEIVETSEKSFGIIAILISAGAP